MWVEVADHDVAFLSAPDWSTIRIGCELVGIDA
jgi:hypothetical protein